MPYQAYILYGPCHCIFTDLQYVLQILIFEAEAFRRALARKLHRHGQVRPAHYPNSKLLISFSVTLSGDSFGDRTCFAADG
jgi:hypothetical protein